MNNEIKQFGTKQEGKEYIPRPGVYAIVISSDDNLAVVKVHGRYFLIGGGLDVGETEEEGLRRETLEETGKAVLSATFLGRANEYFDSSTGHFNKIGSFYKVELGDGKDSGKEASHVFLWVTKEEFRVHARHEAQVWAVENLL